MERMTQKEKIEDYINRFGSITAIEAAVDLGITQLSARICEMEKKGYRFDKEPELSKNRLGEVKHYIRYSFAM